jgi:hypothetical protein
MQLKRPLPPVRVVDLKQRIQQNDQAASYITYLNIIVPYMLDKQDIVTYEQAENIYSVPIIKKFCQGIFSSEPISELCTNDKKIPLELCGISNQEIIPVKMIQLVMNGALIAYQTFRPGTWFTYFLTMPSGLRKIYQCIFRNPIYGILYYCTFYFRVLGESDKEKFNSIAKLLRFPQHDSGEKLVSGIATSIVDNSSTVLIDAEIVDRDTAISVLKFISAKTLTIGSTKTIDYVVSSAVESSPELKVHDRDYAVYLDKQDKFDFNNKEIREQLLFIFNKSQVKREVKSYVKNPKDKRAKSIVKERLLTMKTPTGETICLDECKPRLKTQSDCYCESECGKTTFLSDRKWCWVNSGKCKRPRHLDTFMGREYDYCDFAKQTEPVCFSGTKMVPCQKK